MSNEGETVFVYEGHTHRIIKALDQEHTYRVVNALKDFNYFITETEKWSPVISITAGDEVEAVAKLKEVLTWVEVKLDPAMKKN